MRIPSKYMEDAVEQLSSLPGIGKRTALRLVIQLLNRKPEEIEGFANSFIAMKENVKHCQLCNNISDLDICDICDNPNRSHEIICVVEDVRDVMAIEETSSFKGVYHVLGGVISPMDGVGPNDLHIQSLVEKAQSGQITEVIFALSPTMEGDTTNFYLYKKLKGFELIITTLSRGVSVGSELHYADGLTLSRSIVNRMPFKVEGF